MLQSFYDFQQRRLSLLLLWGLASVITGLLTLLIPRAFWRQFGLQVLLWGAIDAALAAFGLNSANKKEGQRMLGQLDSSNEQKEARTFHRILLVNTFLDVGYVALGAWIMQRFRQRADRRGMGVGILVQGLWLFGFDGLLTREVGALMCR